MPNIKQQCTLKPLLKKGDQVTAAYFPPSSGDADEPSGWYRGTISSLRTTASKRGQKTNACYGPVRYYTVHFEDGDIGRDIPEHFVFLQEEYELLIMNDDEDDEDNETEWKGVRTVTDSQSEDEWAKDVGWYVATIDGEEHTFSLLSDALRAYDSFIVSTKGFKVQKDDLNLPRDVSILLFV